MLALIGIAIGLVIGAILPFIVVWLVGALIPFPMDPSVYPRELGLGIVYGVLAALAFSIWPLGGRMTFRFRRSSVILSMASGAFRAGLPCGGGCGGARPLRGWRCSSPGSGGSPTSTLRLDRHLHPAAACCKCIDGNCCAAAATSHDRNCGSH